MKNRPYRLYWSHIEAWESCPQNFLWGHGWEGIDLGAGPGKRKPLVRKDSRHNALMGLVIGTALEKIYNEELYRTPAELAEKVETLVRREFAFSLGKEYVDWTRAPSRDELLQTCLKGAAGFLTTMKVNRLLGPYSRSEVNLDAWLDDTTPISGRPDLIINREDTGLAIYDGKNSKNPGEYTDPDQLRWYALCAYLKWKVMPQRLAFIYFRYPPGNPPPKHPGPPEDWKGMVEVPLTQENLRDLGVRAKKVHLAMVEKNFAPTPSASACRWCEYREDCAQRHVPKTRTPAAPEPGSAQALVAEAEGIVEIGFR